MKSALGVPALVFILGVGRALGTEPADLALREALAWQAPSPPPARPEPRPAAPSTPAPARPTPDATAAAGSTPTDLTNVSSLPPSTAPEMLGDLPPLPSQLLLQPTPTTNPGSKPGNAGKSPALVPSVRGFKIAKNESPRPQDRLYFSFNYYDDLNGAALRSSTVDLRDVRVFQETFGLEKTFLDGEASLGLRLPLNTFAARSGTPGLDGDSTDVGDLTVIFKAIVWEDRCSGDLVSAGLAVTVPTGPDSFAGAAGLARFHGTSFQPFVGHLWNFGPWYLQGFTAVDVPTNSNDVTMFYNDLGLGYYLYRNRNPDALVTAVVPTIEPHLNVPLDHRGVLHSTDPAGTPTSFDLTLGTHVEFYERSRLAVGVVMPFTGPRPFDVEAVAQFRLRF